MNWARHSPPDIGRVDATSIRCCEASFNGADGVVKNGTSSKERIPKYFGKPNHPVCAAAVASHLFLNGAATPPVSGGELPASRSLTASTTARDLKASAIAAPAAFTAPATYVVVATSYLRSR